MDHLQTDVKRGDRVRRDYFHPVLIIGGNRLRIHRRPERAIRQRKIGNSQSGVLMTHSRAERQLREDHYTREQQKLPKSRSRRNRTRQKLAIPPPLANEQRYHPEQHKEKLREHRMEDSNFVFVKHDSQPAEHSLENHGCECDHSPPAQRSWLAANPIRAENNRDWRCRRQRNKNRQLPDAHYQNHRRNDADSKPTLARASFTDPKPQTKNRRQQPYHRCSEPVAMFVKDPADPFLDRKEEHVVPIAV